MDRCFFLTCAQAAQERLIMEFIINIDVPKAGINECSFTDDMTEALKRYYDYIERAKSTGLNGCVDCSIMVKSEIIGPDEDDAPPPAEQVIDEANAKMDAATEAYKQAQVSPTRLISTNDFQLTILKRGLQALAHEFDADVAELTPAQNYELGMLVGMIEDVLTNEPDEKMLHGFNR